MAGVFCPRCRCTVMLEQDGKSCSNCGSVLVRPAPENEQRTTNPDRPEGEAEAEQIAEAEQLAADAAREAAQEPSDEAPEPSTTGDKKPGLIDRLRRKE